MKLLMIRHGQSEADLLDVHEGRADFALTEKGHLQATAMASCVSKKYFIRRIYASPLKRAMETAAHLAQATGAEIIPMEELMEFQNGLLAGMDRAQAREKYPRVENLPLHTGVYGQESKLEFRFRAENALSRILSENQEEEIVAVVSHGGMINQLYRAFLRLPVDCDVHFPTGDTGLHLWACQAENRWILYANDMSHADKI